MNSEVLTVEVESGTSRRAELLGFPNDLTGREVVRFLIEEGLSVLEKSKGRDPEPNRISTTRAGSSSDGARTNF